METLTPASVCRHSRLQITTRQPTEFVDLTDRLQLLVPTPPSVSASSTSRPCTRPRPSSSTSTSRCCSPISRPCSKQARPIDGRYRHDDCDAAHGESDRGRAPQRPCALPRPAACRRRSASTSAADGCSSAAGSGSSSSSSTARVSARSRSSCSERRGDEGQDDPAGADRGDEPVLAADQVLAVPAARPGHAGRLSCPTTTRSRFRTSTSRRSTWTTSRTWWSSRSTSRRRIARIASPITTGRAAPTSPSAACT